MTHEGTKYAREQYEKQHGITIEDTTSDDVPLWREPYRNRRSSSIQGARVLPAFRLARTRAAATAATAAAEAAAAHMRSLDWDTSDGAVEGESDGDNSNDDEDSDGYEDSDGDESAEISNYLDRPPRIIAQEEAERIREFRTTLTTRYPDEQFPNGPPPLSETFMQEQIISDQIDEGISFTMALSTEDIEEWSTLADEKVLTRIYGGRFGSGLWEVPRCVTQLMLQLRCQVHVNEMFELMRDPGFQIELAQRVAQRPLHDYVTFKVRPDFSDSSDGNDQSTIDNVHGHGEEDSPGTGVDHGSDHPDIRGVRGDEEEESLGAGVETHGLEWLQTTLLAESPSVQNDMLSTWFSISACPEIQSSPAATGRDRGKCVIHDDLYKRRGSRVEEARRRAGAHADNAMPWPLGGAASGHSSILLSRGSACSCFCSSGRARLF